MQKTTILITGATGSTGSPTVELLIKQGYSVRALVRKEDKKSNFFRSLGAEIIVGNMHNMEDMRAAWKGAKRGYFCYPLAPDLLDATVMFAQAAKEVGAEFVVNLSQKQVSPTVKSPATIRHFLSEEVFKWSGLPTAHIRPTFFSEWFLYIANSIKQGKLPMAFPENVQHAPVAGEDLARTIVAIMGEPEKHAGKVYQLFGPELLSYSQIAEIFSGVLHKNIIYEEVSIQQMADAIGIGGFEHFKDHVAKVISDDLFAEPKINDAIRTITGKIPMTLSEYIDKNRSFFAA
ncbi:MAG: NmrA family NAD(P)-binding protein [Bacteroidetes bacterium]|nr:NmrA family NAD(P)-binding protein [Bacteroidota bacterium]